MRWLIVLTLIPTAATAQTTTSCRWYGNEQVCTSNTPAPIQGGNIPDYSRLLGLDRQQSYQQQEALRLKNERVRLENEALQRRKSSDDAEQCKNSAMAALARDDLRAARDALSACVGA